MRFMLFDMGTGNFDCTHFGLPYRIGPVDPFFVEWKGVRMTITIRHSLVNPAACEALPNGRTYGVSARFFGSLKRHLQKSCKAYVSLYIIYFVYYQIVIKAQSALESTTTQNCEKNYIVDRTSASKCLEYFFQLFP